MAKKKADPFPMPNLDNATPGSLVDDLGATRAESAKLKKREGFIKQALFARLDEGQTLVEGEVFNAMIQDTVQERLDTAKIRETEDDDWLADHTNVIEFKQIRTTKKG